jgi:hypothetical protein
MSRFPVVFIVFALALIGAGADDLARPLIAQIEEPQASGSGELASLTVAQGVGDFAVGLSSSIAVRAGTSARGR